jgi:hypothetical protein
MLRNAASAASIKGFGVKIPGIQTKGARFVLFFMYTLIYAIA